MERLKIAQILKLKKIISILSNIPIFDKLNHKEVRNLSIYMDIPECNEGEVIFREGEYSTDNHDPVCGSISFLMSTPKLAYKS